MITTKQMHDLIHTKAYVKDLKREMFIDEYVDRNARGLRIGILENFRETFKGVSVNYEQAFREIKNILGNYCIEKTYFEYLEKLDQLGKKHRGR